MQKCKKKRNYFFVSHKDETLFIFWHAIIFLLLCGNQNILPWYNILNDVQNKNLVLHKNNFVLKQNIWHCTKSDLVSWCLGVLLLLHEKVFHVSKKKVWCSTKKYFMSTKARWCCIKKNILCAKRLLIFSGTARHRDLLRHHCYYYIYDKLHFHRGSRLEVFCKKVVLKNFANFTGKHMCQSQLYLKRFSGTGVFPWILRNF